MYESGHLAKMIKRNQEEIDRCNYNNENLLAEINGLIIAANDGDTTNFKPVTMEDIMAIKD